MSDPKIDLLGVREPMKAVGIDGPESRDSDAPTLNELPSLQLKATIGAEKPRGTSPAQFCIVYILHKVSYTANSQADSRGHLLSLTS